MDRPLDPFFLSLAASDHAKSLLVIYWVVAFFGAAGFVFFWFKAAVSFFRIFKDAWTQKRGIFWMNDPRNPYFRQYFSNVAKGMLVWMLAGWPIILLLTGLVSGRAIEEFLIVDETVGNAELSRQFRRLRA